MSGHCPNVFVSITTRSFCFSVVHEPRPNASLAIPCLLFLSTRGVTPLLVVVAVHDALRHPLLTCPRTKALTQSLAEANDRPCPLACAVVVEWSPNSCSGDAFVHCRKSESHRDCLLEGRPDRPPWMVNKLIGSLRAKRVIGGPYRSPCKEVSLGPYV